ncbi:wall-associated receptor kinase 2-like protein [Tanacetum coccineum]
MLRQYESTPEFGSGSGGCGDDEIADDEDGGEDEEDEEDGDRAHDKVGTEPMCHNLIALQMKPQSCSSGQATSKYSTFQIQSYAPSLMLVIDDMTNMEMFLMKLIAIGECSGNGYCQTSITKGLQFYGVTLDSFQSHTKVWSINRCGLAFVGEVNTFRFGGASDLFYYPDLFQRVKSSVLVVIDWVIGHDRNFSRATKCKENSECHDADGGGYHCRCNQGYEGNPYLDQGCQGQFFLLQV